MLFGNLTMMKKRTKGEYNLCVRISTNSSLRAWPRLWRLSGSEYSDS